MTIIYGQIESLTRIKETLNQKDVNRFNSVGDINKFKRNYEFERQNITNQIEHDLNIEIDDLSAIKNKFQNDYDDLKIRKIEKLNNKIIRLKSKYDLIRSRNTNDLIMKKINWLYFKILKFIKTILEKNFSNIIKLQTIRAEKKLSDTNKKINEYTVNRRKIISERSLSKHRELDYIMEVVKGLQPLIAGAIGENLVKKELKKLSDKYVLINDFSIEFESPIYYKKENERIFSIQIDHLLVTNSGIFIIETKNWSKKSIESFDFRSPVKQIRRTSHALFVILNSDTKQRGINFKKHHWGDKQLPL
jgi:hypothetical protein